MLKAIFYAYRWEYTIIALWSFVIAALQLSSPFILRQLIIYVRSDSDDVSTGIALVLALALALGLAYFITEHITFFARITGCKSTNALIAIIYCKTFTISSATNKKFAQGQLVNFVQVDALKLQFLSSQAPQIMRLPILILPCFGILFYYLKWSFMAGVAVFVITFFVNTAISKKQAELQKEDMRCQDGRVKALTESLNNIKLLKLYSWTAIFASLITEKRNQQLQVLKKRFVYSNIFITSLYFFPSILSAILFSVYIGLGNTLDLDIAFTVMALLNIIKAPLRAMPQFVGQLIEFQVSMGRIQEFLLTSEINTTIISDITQEET